MVAKREVLALIPARGGSKSLPHKNIQLLAGHPLLAFSIAAAQQAEGVSRVVVSTDSEEIAATARQYGAEVPFMRPAEFAQDDSTDLPVFQHALGWLAENEDYRPEIVVQLRPTSPLRPPDLVDRALALLAEHPDADSVRGVVPAGQNPHKMWRLDETGGPMQPLLKVKGMAEPYNAPRQSLPAIYWQTGHIDAMRAATILEKKSMSGAAIYPLLIDPRYTVDIDTIAHLRAAEALALSGEIEIVWPGRIPRPLPAGVRLLVLDFDGTLTDDRVWVDAEGREQVAAHRGDGLGIGLLQAAGVEVFVLSKERNPVVRARCDKLKVPFKQGVDDKAAAIKSLLKERKLAPEQAVYAGNDINDIPCFELVGCAVVVADAHPEARRAADLRLSRPGGHGAVRELCDLILSAQRSAA
jgi:YrbI family 3-deoxy-D-manno-octulosonate 8-phosphate phosphatase